MTLEVRHLGVDDIPVAGNILAAAYGPPVTRGRELQRYLAVQPDGWRLGLLDGRPAGMGGALDYGACAYLGMMATYPDLQRRGVGEAILRDVLAWLDARACPTVLLDASDAGAALYRRHGFVDAGRVVLLRPASPPARSERPVAPGAVAPLHPTDLAAVGELDEPLYGGAREVLLAGYVATYPERVLLMRGPGGTPRGYLVAQAGAIGPWVAASPEDAETLLQAALTLPYDDLPSVIIPEANEAGLRLLARHGFAPRRTLQHMYRGRPWRPRATLYGQASFAAG